MLLEETKFFRPTIFCEDIIFHSSVVYNSKMSLVYFWKDKSVVVAGMVASEASKGMGPDEESFNVTVPVTQKVLYVTTDLIWLNNIQIVSYCLHDSILQNLPWEYTWKKKNKTKPLALKLDHKTV